MEARRGPKHTQNRVQNEVEVEERKSTLLEATWDNFGSLSKGVWEAKLLIFCRFPYDLVQISAFEIYNQSRVTQEPKWSEFGLNRHRKWEPRRAKNEAKNDIICLICFCTDFDRL